MPLILDGAAPGCDSYVWHMPPVTPEVSKSWSYQGTLRSMQWKDGGVVKGRIHFDAHRSADDFYGMLDDGARRGVDRPSSYSSFFHDLYRSPKATGPARRAMDWTVPGGWESLLLPRGVYGGVWYRYDIRSAYLWALYSGLPDPATYRYSEHLDRSLPGVYVVSVRATQGAPYPYDRGGRWPVTPEEIDRYDLDIGRVYYGITWTKNLDIVPMVRAIECWPFWKQVARSYWGRWASLGDLQCTTYIHGKMSKRWTMPSTNANPIWAHLILGRVRARLHDITREAQAARVYVDNVITNTPLPTGNGVGDWRLEHVYPNGISVLNLHRIIDQETDQCPASIH